MGRSKFNPSDSGTLSNRPKRKRVASNGDGWNDSYFSDGLDSEEKRGLFHCNYCQKDITDNVRIKCARCPDFDLCLDCFSVGVELKPHLASHPYHVMESLGFPLFHPDWNSDEEILLLEGIEMFGLGNWNDIANHVGKKTKIQCYDHYKSVYINSPFSPLPDMSPLKGKNKSELTLMVKNAASLKGLNESVAEETTLSSSSRPDDDANTYFMDNVALVSADSTLNSVIGSGKEKDEILSGRIKEESDDGRSSTSKSLADSDLHSTSLKKATSVPAVQLGALNQSTPMSASKPQEEATADQAHSVRTLGRQNHGRVEGDGDENIGGYDFAGYNPKRNEFDPDFDDDAENLITDMDFKDGDSEEDRTLKLKVLNIYHSRVEERKRRKKFILDRGLLNKAHQFIHGRSRTEEDKSKEQEIDKEKAGGKKDRKREEEEQEKEERELYERFKIFARFLNQDEFESLLSDLYSEKKIRKQIQNLQEYRRSGCRLLKDTHIIEIGIKQNDHSQEMGKFLEHSFMSDKIIPSGSSLGDAKSKKMDSLVNKIKEESDLEVVSDDIQRVPNSTEDLRQVMNSDYNIFVHPGANLLSNPECELCVRWRLLPFQYLKIKEAILLQGMRNGNVNKEDIASNFHIDGLKVNAVHEHLKVKGWV